MDQMKQDEIMRAQIMVRKFFGKRLSNWSYSENSGRIEGILYGAIAFSCLIERYGILFMDIRVGDRYSNDFFGADHSARPTQDDVNRVLSGVDEYCRTLLPDKYLDRFDALIA